MPKIGDSIHANNANWNFASDVADHFDEHVRRSIPLYAEGHQLVAQISDFFVRDNSLVYELGCSTGELTLKLAQRNQEKSAKIIAIDLENGMIEKAKQKCLDFAQVEVIQGDITDFDFAPNDLVIAYYTLQFVRPRYRQQVFDRIYQSLNWGGGLVLFEKVRAPDARFQDMTTALYTDFKLDQGFNESEILHKTRSLKGILEPFSSQGNLDLLKRAGFVDIMTIFKYISFEGFLAIK